ncbi:ribonuclease H-like domain-containing protein [Tanacetum coccineum]
MLLIFPPLLLLVAYTVSVPPGFQSVSAQLSAQPTYVSPQLLPGSFGVSNMGMAGVNPTGGSIYSMGRSPHSRGSIRHGVNSSKGCSFPGWVHLGQSLVMPFIRVSCCVGTFTKVGQSPYTFAECIYYILSRTGASAIVDMVQWYGRFIPVTNSGHSVLSTPFRPLCLNNVLITPIIVKNLISVRQFVRDNSCTYTWHQRLGHPGSEVLRRLVSSDSISCNKEKPPVLCHACQLGKHMKLPFVSSSSSVTSCFDIVHSDFSSYFSTLACSSADVKNAFFHGDLAETVFMYQPPRFRDPEHRILFVFAAISLWSQGDDTAFLLLYVDDIVLTASTITTTIGVFPSNISGLSPATCRWGNLSPSKCRWGIVAGESSSGIQSPAIIPSEDVGPTRFSVKQLVPRWQTFPQRHVAGEFFF